uniref:hypothetical protein n=1 Tax=Hericium alpestre TaxID=135208 RepID=UPI002434E06D|nr:hypothetical protein QEO35_mgp44 [Hericium alpestre]WEX31989.1 hypothetical protein [Hericium alpestre]
MYIYIKYAKFRLFLQNRRFYFVNSDYLGINPSIFLGIYNSVLFYYITFSFITFVIWLIILYMVRKGYLGLRMKNNLLKYITNSNLLSLILIVSSILILILLYKHAMDNTIHLAGPQLDYIIKYKNVYVRGLELLSKNYDNFIAYGVGVKLASVYIKHYHDQDSFFYEFSLDCGPKVFIEAVKEDMATIGINPATQNVQAALIRIKDVDTNLEFLKGMVPKSYKDYDISRMTDFEHLTSIISGDAPDIIDCPLEYGDYYNNFSVITSKFLDFITSDFFFNFISISIIILFVYFIYFLINKIIIFFKN